MLSDRNPPLNTITRSNTLFFCLLSYVIVYIIYTWPLALNFLDYVPGKEDSDAWIFLWNTYALEMSLKTGIFPETERLFYPESVNLTAHTYTPLMGLFSMLVGNSAAAINGFLALNFILSGIGGFLLCKMFVRSNLLCFLAGLLFAFSPWKTMRIMEHYNLIMTAAIPFYFMFLIQAFRITREHIYPSLYSKKKAFAAVLMLILTLLSDLILVSYLLIFTVAYLSWPLIRSIFLFMKRINYSNKWVLYSGWSVIFIGFIAASHYGIDFLRHNYDDKGAFWWGSDMLNLMVPWNHLYIAPLFGDALIELAHVRGMEQAAFLGLTMFALMILSGFVIKKAKLTLQMQSLLFSACLFLLLTMPEIKFAGTGIINNSLSVMHFIPGPDKFRSPGRFIMPVYLLLPVCLFYIIEQWGKIQKLYPFLLLLFFIEFLPVRTEMLEINQYPEIIDEIKQAEGEVLLTLPFGIRDGFSMSGYVKESFIWQQSIHDKKLIGGYLARVPDSIWEVYNNDPVMHSLLNLQTDPELDLQEFTEYEIQQFFETFQPDIFLISPEYRHTKAEILVKNLIQNKPFHSKEINDYLMFSQHKEPIFN